jgi:ankyrin repeat protein
MKFPLNIRIIGGPTALTIASELGHFDTVETLIEAGANINKLSEQGDGALLKAIEYNHNDIAYYLIEKGAKMVLSTKYRDKSPLFQVIETQNVEMLKKFKKHNVDLTAKTSSGQSLLKFAADKGLTKIMNYLIKRMPNLDQEDDTGFTIFTKYLLKGEFDI